MHACFVRAAEERLLRRASGSEHLEAGEETTHQGKESDQKRRPVLCHPDPASRVPLTFARVGWVFWCRELDGVSEA